MFPLAVALIGIVEEGAPSLEQRLVAAEERGLRLEAKLAELTEHKEPLALIRGAAALTRAGPNAGRTSKHMFDDAKDAKQAHSYRERMRRLHGDSSGRKLSEAVDLASFVGATDTTMDHTWILLAGLLCWFLQARDIISCSPTLAVSVCPQALTAQAFPCARVSRPPTAKFSRPRFACALKPSP